MKGLGSLWHCTIQNNFISAFSCAIKERNSWLVLVIIIFLFPAQPDEIRNTFAIYV